MFFSLFFDDMFVLRLCSLKAYKPAYFTIIRFLLMIYTPLGN